MNYDMTDKVTVITGSARGIGFALATAFGAAGAKVMVIDLAPEAVDAAVQKLRDQGSQAWGYVGNVTDSAMMEELFARVVAEHGSLDVLINNAGVTRDNLMLRMKEEEWQL
ncbi:MAG TPA: SDR family NAD(P)-dependent oxidoreductase, partial [Candidatus Cloacimonadota bacterium]|nr:SDR family NAD(P)-dependent oxidoreductase [Candidatus Cloacimonadota bacterium]